MTNCEDLLCERYRSLCDKLCGDSASQPLTLLYNLTLSRFEDTLRQISQKNSRAIM